MFYDLKTIARVNELKKSIRNNNREKRLDLENIHDDMEGLYKPFLKPLQDLVDKPLAVTTLPAIESVPSLPPIESTAPLAIDSSTNTRQVTDTSFQTEVTVPPEIKFKTIKMLGPLAYHYLEVIPKGKLDNAYSIQEVPGTDHYRIGRMDVRVHGDNLIIDEKSYKGTEGLWKLLTHKHEELGNREDYSATDLDTYEKILLQTKPFLKDDKDMVKANRGKKWKNWVEPIYKKWRESNNRHRSTSESRTVQGTGVIILPSDPNELVSRHRLLSGSRDIGNTGVFNELQAINDKLLEMGIFDVELVSRLNKQCIEQ